MVCRLNLTEREPPKQLNPINMIPPPPSSSIKLLNTLVLKLGQVIVKTRGDGRLYTISNLLPLLKNYICKAVLCGCDNNSLFSKGGDVNAHIMM